MFEIKAPNRDYTILQHHVCIFLAGSIEMGTAENWQTKITQRLMDEKCVDLIFNPRREEWDSSWVQSIDNPQFKEQVVWELDHLEMADHVFFYFDPNTKSPITLMELGICAVNNSNVMVVCPDGFYRKGNVDILCDRYCVPMYSDFNTAIDALVHKLKG